MPKPIRITDEMKQQMQKEFTEVLDDIKMSDGKINFSKAFKYKDDVSAILWLTPLAYQKTVALVTEFSDEVAWHGSISRIGRYEFVIDDVFVYPQEVTGSTVNTDQEGYTEWLYEFDDEIFNKIRMQGHSHVNMSVSPSGVDDKHREQILEQLDASMFYIFMVWNKQLKTHTLIYDMENNILYDDDDIELKLINNDEMVDFIEDAKDKVQKKSSKNDKKPKKEKEYANLPSDGYYYGMFDQYDLGGAIWRY